MFASLSLSVFLLSLSQPWRLRLELNWDGRVLRCPRTPWCPTPCLTRTSFLITMSLVGLKRVERSVGSSAVKRPERRYSPSISPGKRWCPRAVLQFVCDYIYQTHTSHKENWLLVMWSKINVSCHCDICGANIDSYDECLFARPGSISGLDGLQTSHQDFWLTKILFFFCCCFLVLQVLHGSHPGPSDIRLHL